MRGSGWGLVTYLLFSVAGCGGETNVSGTSCGTSCSGAGGSDGGAGESGGGAGESGGGASGSGGGVPVGRNPKCPLLVPNAHAPCGEHLACEYPIPGAPPFCTTLAECLPGLGDTLVWFVYPLVTGCTLDRSPECPAKFGDLPAYECSTARTEPCMYPEGMCVCTVPGRSCLSSSTLSWVCTPWSVGCPVPYPHRGDACTTPGPCGGDCGTSIIGPLECVDGYYRGVEPAPCSACPAP